MNKQKFKDSLQYGLCRGTREFDQDNQDICRYNNPGKESKTCLIDVIDKKTPERLCNCCDKCRKRCDWITEVKEINRRESKDISEKLQNLVDEYNAKK